MEPSLFVKFWSLSGFRLTEIAYITVASHACVFRGALISSLKNEFPPAPPQKNACVGG